MTPPRHTLSNFQAALDAIRNDVFMMASLTERGMQNATRGFYERDDDACNVAIADDEEIDLLEIQIDRQGVDIILRFQPVATDLRHVVASMKFSVNIERVADQSVSIARRARRLNQHAVLPHIHELDPMFAMAQGMFKDAVRAYSDGDLELARSLKARDRELDVLNNDIADRLIVHMQEDPQSVQGYLNLIFIARALERIGDQCTNMAEDVVYAISAEDIRHLGKQE